MRRAAARSTTRTTGPGPKSQPASSAMRVIPVTAAMLRCRPPTSCPTTSATCGGARPSSSITIAGATTSSSSQTSSRRAKDSSARSEPLRPDQRRRPHRPSRRAARRSAGR
jgi:phage tail tape-measure protein